MIRPLTRVTLSDAVSENDFTLLEESVSIWSVSQIGPAPIANSLVIQFPDDELCLDFVTLM